MLFKRKHDLIPTKNLIIRCLLYSAVVLLFAYFSKWIFDQQMHPLWFAAIPIYALISGITWVVLTEWNSIKFNFLIINSMKKSKVKLLVIILFFDLKSKVVGNENANILTDYAESLILNDATVSEFSEAFSNALEIPFPKADSGKTLSVFFNKAKGLLNGAELSEASPIKDIPQGPGPDNDLDLGNTEDGAPAATPKAELGEKKQS